MADLLTVHEARLQLLSGFKPLGTIEIPFYEGLGRVLAETIYAKEDIPLFPNSSMDGFAVLSADVSQASKNNPISLPIGGEIAAGSSIQSTLRSGTVLRIMTGAPLPAGADAVIPIEEIIEDSSPSGKAAVLISSPVRPGQYVRPRGQDLRAGEAILQPGQQLSPQDLGLLATLGAHRIQVYETPRIALISSGDELIRPDQPLTPGKIRDANSYLLSGLIARCYAHTVALGIAADRFDAVQEKMDAAVEEKVDLILTSAGVSVGTYDFVREVIETQGKLTFWRVNIRPGKPFAFGSYRNIPIIGLPGNPVSAFVCFEIFVKPVIERLSGLNVGEPPLYKAILKEEIESDGRESYLRGRVTYNNGKFQAALIGHQGSGNLRALSAANALLIVPSGVKSLPAGSEVNVWLLDNSII